MGNAWVEEQLLRNAALKYARAAFQPEEQRRRVTHALDVARLLDSPDRVLFEIGELDAARDLARLTLLHAGWNPDTLAAPCTRVDCPRDGDCPVHGKDRPGQCVTVEGQEAQKPGGPEARSGAPFLGSLQRDVARGRQLIEELEGAVTERQRARYELRYIAFDSLENRDWLRPTRIVLIARTQKEALVEAKAAWAALPRTKGYDGLPCPRSPELVSIVAGAGDFE